MVALCALWLSGQVSPGTRWATGIATERCRPAREESPTEPRAQIQLAFLYEQTGETSKALNLLSEGLRYRPNSPSIWMARANILYGRKQFDEAQAALLKVMQLTEPAAGQEVKAGAFTRLRAAAAYQLALMDVASTNFEEAEPRADSLGPNFNGPGYHLALAQSLRGEGRAAEATAESALELQQRMAQQRANEQAPPSVRQWKDNSQSDHF